MIEVPVHGSALVANSFDRARRPGVSIGVAPDDTAADLVWPQVQKCYHCFAERLGARGVGQRNRHAAGHDPWLAMYATYPAEGEYPIPAHVAAAFAFAWLDKMGNTSPTA